MRKNISTNSRDPVTTYARQVLSGKIVAGPVVRDACRRHMRDLETGPARGFFFDLEKAMRIINFFPDVLKLNAGKHEGQPFRLLPWQKFIVGSLFGWVKADGTRRFTIAYIETAKGSGKSPFAAGIGMYCLIADNEPRAEIYAAATKKDQAMVLFRAAVAMYYQSPALSASLVPSGGRGKEWNLAYHKNSSFFRPISSDDGQSGPLPHCSLVDELHEHRDSMMLAMLEAGQKSRRQPLTIAITNSGKKKLGVCWDYHQKSRKVCSGAIEDDSFFAYVCANDLAEDGKIEIDPFDHPEEWIKTNPSLGETIQVDYLKKAIIQARTLPSVEATVRRLNFNQWGWGSNANPWLNFEDWLSAGRTYTLEDLAGRKAYLGLDLSAVSDLTAAVFLVEPDYPGEAWHLLPYFWLPEEGLQEREAKENIPWFWWKNAGFLHTCPGKTVDYAHMGRTIQQVCQQLRVQLAGRDPWNKLACDKQWEIEQIGFPFEFQDVRQGYQTMSPAIKELERRILNGQLAHPQHPILNMCVGNAAITTDPSENVKFTKAEAEGRIDGIVAAAIATSLTIDSTAQYETLPDDYALVWV